MKTPKVSIIMNCYNGEKYLRESVKSILGQSYINWELIFWNNRSSDDSEKIFKEFKDKRLFYFLAENHTNLHEARNLALAKTNGEYLTFLDTDDYWKKDKLYLQVQILNNQKNVGCVHSKFWVKYEKSILPDKLVKFGNLPEGNIFNALIDEYNFGFGTVLIKKNTLKNFPNIFDTSNDYIADFDFTLKFAKENIIGCVQKPIYVYRKHKQNFTNFILDDQILQFEDWLNKKRQSKFFNEEEYTKLNKHLDYLKLKLKIKRSDLKGFLNLFFSKKISFLSIKMILFFLFKKF